MNAFQPQQLAADPLGQLIIDYFRKNGWIVIFTIIVFYYSKKLFLYVLGILKYYLFERRRIAQLDQDKNNVRQRQLRELEISNPRLPENSTQVDARNELSSNEKNEPSTRHSTHSTDSSKHLSSSTETSSSYSSSGSKGHEGHEGSSRHSDCGGENPFDALFSSDVGPTGIKYRPRKRRCKESLSHTSSENAKDYNSISSGDTVITSALSPNILSSSSPSEHIISGDEVNNTAVTDQLDGDRGSSTGSLSVLDSASLSTLTLSASGGHSRSDSLFEPESPSPLPIELEDPI